MNVSFFSHGGSVVSDRSTPSTGIAGRSILTGQQAVDVIPGVGLTLRKHQRILLSPKPINHVFVVLSGVVLVEARLADRPRQVLEILYPDDVFHTQDAPELLGAALVAATSAEMQRFRPEVLETLVRGNHDLARRMNAAEVMRSARRTLHLTSMSGHSGDERLADFLIELGTFRGTPVPGAPSGRTFDMPLSREEIADYLALNPDTLSRIFSRLKAAGLISISRGRATVPDWSALARLSPLAEAIGSLIPQQTMVA